MLYEFLQELSQFGSIMIQGKGLVMGVIIIILMFVPFLFTKKIINGVTSSISDAIFYARILLTYYTIIYSLIVYYNGTYRRREIRIDFRFEPLDIVLGNGFGNLPVNLFGGGNQAGGAQDDGDNQNRQEAVDRQNVHDSGVQNYIVKSVAELKKRVKNPPINSADCVKQIKTYIFRGYPGSDTVKEMALLCVNAIKRINGTIVRIKMNEMEILQLVWNRICDPVNAKICETLKENMVTQLADGMFTENNAYCIQGRVSRIIQSLEQADQEDIVNIKPLWAIKQELVNNFIKLRKDFLSKLSKEQLTIYNDVNELTTEKKQQITAINQKMSKYIMDNLQRDFVAKKLITLKQFQEHMKPYFAELS